MAAAAFAPVTRVAWPVAVPGRLETTGKVSALPTEAARPLTYGDLKEIAECVAAEVLRRQKGARGGGEKDRA